MAAYVIATYDIADPRGYEAYASSIRPLLQKHRGEILVADRHADTLDGQPRSVYVVLQFETEQAARAWYEDPEYRAPKELRIASTRNASLVLAKGFVPPA